MTTILQSGPAICSSSEVDQASQYLTGVFDMKLIAGSLLSPLLCTAFVFAQTYQPPPHFNHIVIIVQENRTPDNIFGSSPSLGCGQEDPFETGVDIQNGGKNIASQNHGGPYITCSQALSGLNGGGGNHHHDFD
jgi:phospholipase C